MVQGMIAGVDLGGTKILAGLFDQQGQLRAKDWSSPGRTRAWRPFWTGWSAWLAN